MIYLNEVSEQNQEGVGYFIFIVLACGVFSVSCFAFHTRLDTQQGGLQSKEVPTIHCDRINL